MATNRTLFRILLFVAALLAGDALSQTGNDSGSQVPELVDRLADFESASREVAVPFEERQKELRLKYSGALEGLMERSTAAGDLDAALAVKREKDLVEGGGDVLRTPPADAGGEELMKLRGIYEEEWKKISLEKGEVLNRLRSGLIGDLKALEVSTTQEKRLEDAIAIRAVRERMEKGTAAEVVSTAAPVNPVKTIDRALFQRMQEEGGRLRVSGTIMPSLPAAVDELESLPTDFVAVHAFRTAWIGIRKNGSSFVMGLDRNRQLHQVEKGWRIELVARGYDSFCYERRNLVHRLVNWEIDRKSSISSPIAIASNHANAILFNRRGETEFHGSDREKDTRTPAKALLGSVRDVVSTKHTFLVIDEGGRGKLWDAQLGRVVPNPLLETSILRDAEGGEQHYVVVDQNGVVSVIPALNASPSVQNVPANPKEVMRVKAGGDQSAVQFADGTWQSWGESPFVSSEVSRIGVAPDLDVYYGEDADYVIWIEPVR